MAHLEIMRKCKTKHVTGKTGEVEMAVGLCMAGDWCSRIVRSWSRRSAAICFGKPWMFYEKDFCWSVASKAFQIQCKEYSISPKETYLHHEDLMVQ